MSELIHDKVRYQGRDLCVDLAEIPASLADNSGSRRRVACLPSSRRL